MKIPVRNIYWLLLYAWDALEEAETIELYPEGITSLADLYAAVLTAGTEKLLRRGLDRAYVLVEETIPGVRGRIDIQTTATHLLRAQAKTHCRFDELSYDTTENQILKAAFRRLVRADLDAKVRERVRRVYRRLSRISDLELRASSFQRVQLYRNNRSYRLLLNVAWLIHQQAVIDEASGSVRFRDFRRNRRAMARLFEEFVRNFLRRHCPEAKVNRRRINWVGAAGSGESLDHLPEMEADVVVEGLSGTVVIDTKFYRNPLVWHRDRRRVRSGHLYQIFSYIKNLDKPAGHRVDGMLLYAAAGETFEFNYEFPGFAITVRTLDLGLEWCGLKGELLEIGKHLPGAVGAASLTE